MDVRIHQARRQNSAARVKDLRPPWRVPDRPEAARRFHGGNPTALDPDFPVIVNSFGVR
jgi:hypothetical protein